MLGAALAAVSMALPAAAGESARRGPLGTRDEWLLAQTRLTLPAASPDALVRGETRLRLQGDWGNDFGVERDAVAAGVDVGFLVDGEHRSLVLDLLRGLTDSVTVGVRLPLRWRGGGVLDGVIDAFHDATGLPGGARPAFPSDRFRVEGRGQDLQPLRWSGRPGTGLGDLELNALVALTRRAREGWSAAIIARSALPTGTGPFRTAGLQAGAQLVAARGLGGAADLYLGVGATASTRRNVDGLRYAPVRGQAFAAFEWRPWTAWSLLVEGDVATRLVENLAAYPGRQAYLKMGAKVDLPGGFWLEGGFAEGIVSLDATTDFGVFLSIGFSSRNRAHAAALRPPDAGARASRR